MADANQVIGDGTERVSSIVHSLRSFARLDEAEFLVADLHEGIESALTLLQPQIGDGITIVKNFGELRQGGDLFFGLSDATTFNDLGTPNHLSNPPKTFSSTPSAGFFGKSTWTCSRQTGKWTRESPFRKTVANSSSHRQSDSPLKVGSVHSFFMPHTAVNAQGFANANCINFICVHL